jgi:hypothetical protein
MEKRGRTARHLRRSSSDARALIREAELAEQLDPLSVATRSDVGWVYYWGRRYDRAIDHPPSTSWLCGENIDPTQNIVRPHRRQVAADLIGPRICDPISDKWPRPFAGSVANLQFQNHAPRFADVLRQHRGRWNRSVARFIGLDTWRSIFS